MATNQLKKVTNDSDASYCKMPDGVLIQWGRESTSSSGYTNISYPVSFNASSSITLIAVPRYTSGMTALDYHCITSLVGTSGGTIYFRDNNNAAKTSNAGAFWLAIGRWK